MSDDLKSIEREIRDWASRPPVRSPRMARTRVLARIDERRAWRLLRVARRPLGEQGLGQRVESLGSSYWGARRRWGFAAAAAMVAVLAVGLLLPRTPEAPSEPPVRMASTEPATSEGAGLLVYELESGTKLYMALAMTTPLAETTMEGN